MDKPANKLVWNLCVPFGTWLGHPNGEQTYNADDGRAIVDYFHAKYGNGKAMVIDYEHNTFIGDSRAAGWVWDLEVRENAPIPGVYMQNEWTPIAEKMIKSNEYKYLSPVIIRNDVDPVTGEEVPIQLFTVALTNVPFMQDKFEMVAASAVLKGKAIYSNSKAILVSHKTNTLNGANAMDLQEIYDAIVAALAPLGVPATASPEQVLSMVEKLAELMQAFPSEVPEEAQEQLAEMNTAVRLFTDAKALLNANNDNVLAIIQTLKNGSVSRDNDIRRELAEIKADRLIERYANRIPKQEDRDYWRAKAIRDYADTEETLKRLEPVLNSAPTRVAESKSADGLTDSQRRIAKMMNVSVADYKKQLDLESNKEN